MSFTDFLASPEARVIAPVLLDEATISEMEMLSRRGRPAVQALDGRLAGLVELDDTQRQHVGRWIREVLGARGWRTRIQRRFANGALFSSGTVYERTGSAMEAAGRESAVAPAGFRERLAAARRIVRDGTRNSYSVDDFISDKHREAEREAAARP